MVRSLVKSDWIDRLPKGAASSFQERKAILPPTIPEIQKGVEICVRDCGIGIPDAHLERIFDRFHRVDTRLTREAGGLGLGLSIYKRIVELHGGLIWAESEIGKGSAFYIWLPSGLRTYSRGSDIHTKDGIRCR